MIGISNNFSLFTWTFTMLHALRIFYHSYNLFLVFCHLLIPDQLKMDSSLRHDSKNSYFDAGIWAFCFPTQKYLNGPLKPKSNFVNEQKPLERKKKVSERTHSVASLLFCFNKAFIMLKKERYSGAELAFGVIITQ